MTFGFVSDLIFEEGLSRMRLSGLLRVRSGSGQSRCLGGGLRRLPLSGFLPRLEFKILKAPTREPDSAKRPPAMSNIVPGPLGQTGPKA